MDIRKSRTSEVESLGLKKIKYPRKILIVKPSSLGDVVHSLPFLNVLRERFPKAEIHWVIAYGLEGLLAGHLMVNKLWIIHKDRWKKVSHVQNSFKEFHSLFRELRKAHFDIVIDLQGLLRSGIITRATGAPIRIGFKEAREGSRFFYTHKVRGGRDIHAVDRYLQVADFLGCDISNVCFPFPFYNKLSAFSLQPSDPGLQLSKDYAVIVPGARWKTKKWPDKKFGELTSLLPLQTIIVGSKKDMDTASKIVSLSRGKALSLAGKTDLKGLIEVIRRARFVVSNDSGPMHIAAALRIPVFAIFGPTDPLRTGPYGNGHTIIKENISCAPCFKKTCDDMKCIEMLSVEKVYEIIKAKT